VLVYVPIEGFMKNKEFILVSIYISLFIFLLLWIYPSNSVSTEIEDNFKESKVLYTSKEIKVFSHFTVKSIVVDKINEIEYSHTELVKEEIGQRSLKTGAYKRIRYLARYQYDVRQKNTSNTEYVFLFEKIYNICEESCKIVKMYVYDAYEVVEVKRTEIIYSNKEIDIYKVKTKEIYEDVIIPVYIDKKEDIYVDVCINTPKYSIDNQYLIIPYLRPNDEDDDIL
jgi:hypothetical protein